MERDEFRVHLLNEEGIEKAKKLATQFSQLLDFCEELGTKESAGRELAIVRTKLQEASFWAKRAMAMNPKNQKP